MHIYTLLKVTANRYIVPFCNYLIGAFGGIIKIPQHYVRNTEKSSNFAHRRTNYKFYNDTQKRFRKDAFPPFAGKDRCGQPFV